MAEVEVQEVNPTTAIITTVAELNALDGLTATQKKAFADHAFTGILRVTKPGDVGIVVSDNARAFSSRTLVPGVRIVVFNWNPVFNPDSEYFDKQMVRNGYNFSPRSDNPEENVPTWKDMFAFAKQVPAFAYNMGRMSFSPDDKAIILCHVHDIKPATAYKGVVAGA